MYNNLFVLTKSIPALKKIKCSKHKIDEFVKKTAKNQNHDGQPSLSNLEQRVTAKT